MKDEITDVKVVGDKVIFLNEDGEQVIEKPLNIIIKEAKQNERRKIRIQRRNTEVEQNS